MFTRCRIFCVGLYKLYILGMSCKFLHVFYKPFVQFFAETDVSKMFSCVGMLNCGFCKSNAFATLFEHPSLALKLLACCKNSGDRFLDIFQNYGLNTRAGGREMNTNMFKQFALCKAYVSYVKAYAKSRQKLLKPRKPYRANVGLCEANMQPVLCDIYVQL